MRSYHRYFLLLLFLLTLAVLWAITEEGRKPYKGYQKIYATRKIAQLEEQALAAESPDGRGEILRQIRAVQQELPRIQEVTLFDGRRERCLSCHIGIEQISDAHPVQSFGCVLCHGGDPLSVTLPAAHQGLIGGRNPSDFAVIDQSCGKEMPDGTACHNGDALEERDHIQRVKTTIMATKAGEFAHTRYSFGAQKDPSARYGVAKVRGRKPGSKGQTARAVQMLEPLPYTRESDLSVTPEGEVVRSGPAGSAFPFSGHPIDTQLHENCANACHLWSRGSEGPYLNRASGCAACHYLYDNNSFYRGGDPTIPRDAPGHGPFHRLTLKIPYSQCNHCHNRGVHSLLKMRFNGRTDLENLAALSEEQRRIQDYYNPMTLFTLCEFELDCIDCHTDREVMGDGYIYSTKADQQRIRCYTCHGTLRKPPLIRNLTSEESPKIQRIMRSHARKPGARALFSSEGEIQPHIRFDGDEMVLTAKVTGNKYKVPQVFGGNCRQDPDKQDANSCHGCHDIHLKKTPSQ
jgi:hypothetical protein